MVRGAASAGEATLDKRHLSLYISAMIRSFRHKALKRLFEDDDPRRLPPADLKKIKRILAKLNMAESLDEVDAPGFRLHPLKGDLKGHWAVTVRANWRIVFRFEGSHAVDVDYVDYH